MAENGLLNGNGWWRSTALVLASALVGMMSTFFLIGTDHPTTAQMLHAIQTEGGEERGKATERMEAMGHTVDQTGNDVRELRKQVDELRTNVLEATGAVHGMERALNAGGAHAR